METFDTQPILSIAIPTFNGARTIKNMLNILLPQIDERVELFVVDNASTDETPKIIEKYKLDYPFIGYFRNESNIGADGNFLKCMKMAKGKYIYLLSDDDILVEGALQRILGFLEKEAIMGLIYLGTANFYAEYTSPDKCRPPKDFPTQNICTEDKKLFMQYAKHFWGFVSSFIIRSEIFKKMENPEMYFGTYWLQSYIHIFCASGSHTKLGIVGNLNVAAGVYITQNNLDHAKVDGNNYRMMLDYAIINGFDLKQLDRWYYKRLTMLASHGIVKEKATGNKKIDKQVLSRCINGHPILYIKIFSMYLVPSFICKWYMNSYRKFRGVKYKTEVNRQGDVITDKKQKG